MSRAPRAPHLRAAAIGAALLAATATLHAHDFWLVPSAFTLRPGEQLEVRGQTSSRFPTSESAVATDRVADARIIAASEEAPIRDLAVSGTSLRIRHRPTAAGQRIVAVALHPRSVRESAEGFRRYLVLEGAPEALERYQREGLLPTDSITRRYAKYAKTVVEVGRGGPRAFHRAAGYPLEFVPLRDPAGLRAGDTLDVRLLYRGSPLPGARVHADGVPGAAGLSPEAAAAQAVTAEAETDAQGVARVPVGRAGLWNVRTIHIVPAAPGSGADWDTHWATLVFSVDEPRTGVPAAAGAVSDSAAVAALVDRFHRALAAGDTAAVLGMLARDVIVQESGGEETREEYRSHHLPGDMAFARAVARERSPIRVSVHADIAWATSTSTTVGEYRGRAVNSQGAELMVLRRDAQGWKIVAIHWSSRARRS